jgi:hypothetical protein
VKEYKKLERVKRLMMINEKKNYGKDGKFNVDKYIREKLKEINPNEDRIVNVLVEELYGRSITKNKNILWDSFGDILVRNLRKNIKGTKQCECCGERIIKITNRTKYCDNCWNIKEKEIRKEINRKYYQTNKIKTV